MESIATACPDFDPREYIPSIGAPMGFWALLQAAFRISVACDAAVEKYEGMRIRQLERFLCDLKTEIGAHNALFREWQSLSNSAAVRAASDPSGQVTFPVYGGGSLTCACDEIDGCAINVLVNSGTEALEAYRDAVNLCHAAGKLATRTSGVNIEDLVINVYTLIQQVNQTRLAEKLTPEFLSYITSLHAGHTGQIAVYSMGRVMIAGRTDLAPRSLRPPVVTVIVERTSMGNKVVTVGADGFDTSDIREYATHIASGNTRAGPFRITFVTFG